MSGFDDLGPALRADAERHAPRADSFDVDALTRAARARRAPRLWAAGALAATAVLGLGGLALTLPGLSAPELLASSSEESATLEAADDSGGGMTTDMDLGRAMAFAECGVGEGAIPEHDTTAGVRAEVVDLRLQIVDESMYWTGTLALTADVELTLDSGVIAVAIVDDSGTVVAADDTAGLVVPRVIVVPGRTTTVALDGATPLCSSVVAEVSTLSTTDLTASVGWEGYISTFDGDGELTRTLLVATGAAAQE